MRFRTVQLCLLSIVLAAASAFPQNADQTVVWRLGNFDHTSGEFHGNGKQSIVVDANSADAAAKWPAMQPGSLNAKEKLKAQPRRIHFHISGTPRGSYTLELAVMLGYPRVPHLQLDLNDATGLVFLDRKLSYHAEGRMDRKKETKKPKKKKT